MKYTYPPSTPLTQEGRCAYFEEKAEDEEPDCENLFCPPYITRQRRSQLPEPLPICLVRLQDLPSRHSQINQILLCSRIRYSSPIVRLDVPVMSVEDVVEEGLNEVIEQEEVGH